MYLKRSSPAIGWSIYWLNRHDGSSFFYLSFEAYVAATTSPNDT
jgi:hypothetical protein